MKAKISDGFKTVEFDWEQFVAEYDALIYEHKKGLLHTFVKQKEIPIDKDRYDKKVYPHIPHGYD